MSLTVTLDDLVHIKAMVGNQPGDVQSGADFGNDGVRVYMWVYVDSDPRDVALGAPPKSLKLEGFWIPRNKVMHVDPAGLDNW